MWKYILSFLWNDKSKLESSLQLDEAYTVISECEQLSPVKEPENVIAEEIRAYETQKKIGKITDINNDTYVIDDLYNFTTDISNVSIGTKISYQLIKSENGDIKVIDVHVLENDWDIVETGKKSWHDRILICLVIKRVGRIITLTPGEIIVNLNEVCSEFIPIEGDWVELDVKCEFDENVVDLNGKVLEVNKLQAMRPQLKLGQVTQWDFDSNTGVIDRNIFFNKDSLYCGYLPVKGDKVVAEIIESNQGMCTWRALKILPDFLHSSEGKDNYLNNNVCLDTHDKLSITDNISLTFTKLGERKLFIMEIESEEEVELVCIQLPKLDGQCCLASNIDHCIIKPQQPFTIRLECKARIIGESREFIIFHFKDFKIKRLITIFVVPLNTKKHFQENPQKYSVPRTNKEIIRGPKVHRSARFIPFHMPDFAVPERLLKLLKEHNTNLKSNILRTELEKMKPCLVTTLNYMNFEDKFHTLLHLDEIYTLLEMQNYDQERVCFVKCDEYLLLEIDNLSERRPSVIVGDRVFARSLKNDDSPDYEGYVHKTGKNHLYLKFCQIFHDSYDGEDYSVYIVASRVTYKRKHFAVNLAVRNLGKDWLFPNRIVEKEPQLELAVDSDSPESSTDQNPLDSSSSSNIGKQRLLEKIRKFHESLGNDLPVRKLEWHNKNLNYYQKEAVRNIILGVCRPLPYIIFGPPGTGKTITVVETVLQILRLMPHSRILVSAPSNSAADLLAFRLIDSGVLKPGDLIRLVALSAMGSVPSRLAPYCATAKIEREGTETSLPVVSPSGLVLGYSSAVLGRHRITVCTCSSAGLLYSMGFSKGHFSHIIVDEAGQTSEPTVLIPLAFLDISSGQAILAGDPMQLGPVVLSRLASEYGLEESFLERMINRFPYVRDSQGFPNSCGYDPRLITKLLYNYRSLPVLLKLPSLLFYNDELIPTISETGKEAALLDKLKEILPVTSDGKTPSIVCHGVIGVNFQTEDSPSWFNPAEASQVFYYVNECYRLGLSASDIGIITPYKAQTRQLMELFKEAEFDLPKVGTVEEFQGQEFNVIILSTVRSNKKYVASDLKYTMGFISSPRRLNVSITRAKSLLIIVGNPDLLSTDRCWRSVISYCNERGSFIGTTSNQN